MMNKLVTPHPIDSYVNKTFNYQSISQTGQEVIKFVKKKIFERMLQSKEVCSKMIRHQFYQILILHASPS